MSLILFVLTSQGALSARALEALSWEDSVRETSQRNPDLTAAREAVRQAEAEHRASFSSFLPQVSADAGTSRANTATSVQSVGGSGVREEYSLGLSAKQSLFSGFANQSAVKSARAQLDQARAGFEETSAAVGFELKDAFSALLYSQEQTKLTETIAERRQENVRLVGLRHEAGREHKGSYLKSRAAAAQANYEAGQAKRALRVAERDMARVLGLQEFETLTATGALTAVAPPSTIPDFKSLVLETPAYRQAEAQSRVAVSELVSARSQLFPDISASGSASRRGPEWPPETDRWSVGVNLSFPFFPGGRNIFDIRAAAAGKRQSAAQLMSIRDKTVLDLEDTFASYQDAAEKTVVQKEFLEAAQVRAQIARSQYTSGLLSFEDWDLIENDLISSQKNWLSSLREAALAEASWEKVQGKGPLHD